MTTIPPNWLGSIIQSQGAQERAGQAKSAEEAKGTERGAFSDKLRDVIENTDRDVEVYSDAEGTGSQGSPSSEAEEPALTPQSKHYGDAGAVSKPAARSSSRRRRMFSSSLGRSLAATSGLRVASISSAAW